MHKLVHKGLGAQMVHNLCSSQLDFVVNVWLGTWEIEFRCDSFFLGACPQTHKTKSGKIRHSEQLSNKHFLSPHTYKQL